MLSWKVSTRFLQFVTVSLIRNQGFCQTAHSSVCFIPTYCEIMSLQKYTTTKDVTPAAQSGSTGTTGSSQVRQGIAEDQDVNLIGSSAVPSSSFRVYSGVSSSAGSMPLSATHILSTPSEGASCDRHDCERSNAEYQDCEATTLKQTDIDESLTTELAGTNDPIDISITSSVPESKKPRMSSDTAGVPYTAYRVPSKHSRTNPQSQLHSTQEKGLSEDGTAPAKMEVEMEHQVVEKVNCQSSEMNQCSVTAESESDFSELNQELPFYTESDTSDIFVKEEGDASEIDGEVIATRSKKRGRKKKPKKKPKPAPNAFVSVRIPSPEIRQKMEDVQQKMLERDENLRSTFVSLVKSHLTLMVFRLNTKDEIEKAKTALTEASEEVESSLVLEKDPLVLKFGGIGNFSTKVVYGKIEEGSSKKRLSSMTEIVQDVFSKHGLPTMDSRKFSPHLTIAKVNQKASKEGVKGIALEAYSDLLSMDFGSQEIQGLELLSMSLPETDDGYYHSFHRCVFNKYRSGD